MKRLCIAGLLGVATLACAACGGGTQSAARPALPTQLVKQIKAEVRKPSIITGSPSANTVTVYGPASRGAIEKISSPGATSVSAHVSGSWYLIVLHGSFDLNSPVPPGAQEPHGRVAMEVWSPTATGRGYSVGNRLPKAVSRLRGPAVVDLG